MADLTFIKGRSRVCNKGLDYIHTNIKSYIIAIEDGRKAREEMINLSSKLYNKFKKFVDSNSDLFESGFMQRNNPTVWNSEISDEKSAIKLHVKSDGASDIILIPFDFISNEKSYAARRRIIMSFGKDVKKDDVSKYYESKIKKMLSDVKDLEDERDSVEKDLEKF